MRRTALDVAARILERRLNANRSDHAGPRLACSCGRQARHAGRRPKTFTTVLGPLTLERAFYHCRHCGGGLFPRDRAFGLEGGSLSPGAARMTCRAAAEVSFAAASGLLRDLAGLGIDAKKVERWTKAIGTEIADDERNRVEGSPHG